MTVSPAVLFALLDVVADLFRELADAITAKTAGHLAAPTNELGYGRKCVRGQRGNWLGC